MSQHSPSVLVVGAGPVGMFAALTLARRRIPVQVVDTGLWACSHSYALALHPQSLDLLKQVGLLEQVWAAANPVRKMGFYDSAGLRAQVQLSDADGESPLAVVRQSALEDLLEKSLQDLDTTVLWRHEVAAVTQPAGHASATLNKFTKKSVKDPDGHEVHIDWTPSKTTGLNVDFILGADGHNSQIRRCLAFDFPEVGPATYYAVFEFKSDYSNVDETCMVLGDRTTDVLWPLPDSYYRWSFQLPDYSDTEAEQLKDRLLVAGFGHFPTRRLKDRVPAAVEWGVPPALDQEHLQTLIAERAPWFTGSIDQLSWRTIVRFEQRLSNRLGDRRIWLAGDAAHLALPAGVQSMNLGLHEAHELCNVFARQLSGEAASDELSAFERRWTATWRQLYGLSGGLRPTPRADPWIRDRADRLISCLPAYGGRLRRYAAQLHLEAPEPGLETAANVGL